MCLYIGVNWLITLGGGDRPRVLGTLIDEGFTFERWGRLVRTPTLTQFFNFSPLQLSSQKTILR